MSGMQVVIADPGWRNAVYVPVAAPSASWQVSSIGRFSAQLPERIARGLGYADLKGKWLRYDDPLMGPWGGEIKRDPSDARGGTLELSADSFHGRMRRIRTPIASKTLSGSPGQLAMRLITRSSGGKRLWFDSIAASSGGAAIRLDLRGDDLYDVIEGLARDNDHEFNVTLNDDGTIDWEFRRRVGSDKTGSVILVVADGQLSPSIDELVNDILAVSDEQEWMSAPKRRVRDTDSSSAYERQAVTRQYAGSSGVASLVVQAKQELAIAGQPALPATISLAGNDPVLRSIREGDTTRLWCGNQRDQFFFRCISRSIDRGGDTPTAKLAGDCTIEAAP